MIQKLLKSKYGIISKIKTLRFISTKFKNNVTNSIRLLQKRKMVQ